ncbi:MAG: hypothetical protein JKY48_11550 [Flavobacteriales bacterium]|nr:hypothetical protein [Flavobacteriales bacterium]
MNTNKLLRTTVVALIIINLITIGSIFLNKNSDRTHHKGRKYSEPREAIITALNFDSEQQIAYKQLIKNHRSSIKTIEQERVIVKKALYLLLNEKDQSSKDSLLERLSSYQLKIESTHFNHFNDIRSICKEDQLSKFESLSKKIGCIFQRKPMKKH